MYIFLRVNRNHTYYFLLFLNSNLGDLEESFATFPHLEIKFGTSCIFFTKIHIYFF